MRTAIPRLLGTSKRPPQKVNMLGKSKVPLLKLVLGLCPMQWLRAESAQSRQGRVIFIIVEVGGEGISRDWDTGCLAFV